MLRKRASFKPNLKQVNPQPSQPSLTAATLAVCPPPTEPISNNESEQVLVSLPAAENVVDNSHQKSQSALSVVDQQQSQQQLNQQSKLAPPSQQQPQESLLIAASTTATPVSATQDNADQPSSQHLVAVANNDTSKQPEVSDQRVQEAITQLTGQRFEPIKSLSLRSSANKNVKLKDLLFFNPPMTKDQKRHKKSVFLSKKNEKKKNATNIKEAEEQTEATSPTNSEKSQSTVNEPSLVPKVKIGPDGKLVLDESSTIINRKNSLDELEAIVEDNEDVISRTNYDSFRRRPSQTSQTKWSIEDTKKFYQALTILGTDFSMMESLLFSGLRSRTELHKKFKREERVNKLKIDIALSNRISLNSEELEDLREVFYNS